MLRNTSYSFRNISCSLRNFSLLLTKYELFLPKNEVCLPRYKLSFLSTSVWRFEVRQNIFMKLFQFFRRMYIYVNSFSLIILPVLWFTDLFSGLLICSLVYGSVLRFMDLFSGLWICSLVYGSVLL